MSTLKVLGAMMQHGRGQFSGAEISKQCNLPSGTLYPILARLEQAGWLESQWEEGDPTLLGRPRRRLYRVTALGAQKIAQTQADVSTTFGAVAWG